MGSWSEAEEWLRQFPNSYIGITAGVTNPSRHYAQVRDVVRNIPINRLLLETDAPYFVPRNIDVSTE